MVGLGGQAKAIKIAGGCDSLTVMRRGQVAGFCSGCERDVDGVDVALDSDQGVVFDRAGSANRPSSFDFADKRKNAAQTGLGDAGDDSSEGADAKRRVPPDCRYVQPAARAP